VQELAHHPVIRAKVRELVAALATVTTAPTAAGDALLDPFHVHGAVKRIAGKPACALMRDFAQQWLHMREAEKAGLLTARCALCD
jgi:hypothetical protein